MRQPSFEEISAIHADFRDHITDATHAEFEVGLPPVFGLVLIKAFGYCFNTFEAIGFLLPEFYYEQSNALVRILWEGAANLAWVAADPAPRAKLFAQFTVVERRRFLQLRAVEARRRGSSTAVTAFETELRQFDEMYETVLTDYRFDDHGRRKRFHARFSGPTLESIIQRIGDPWLTEYRDRYPLWCFYAHASPGAVLFPNPFLNELTKAAFEPYDKPRTVQVALWSMAIKRVHRVLCDAVGREDIDYFDKLDARIKFRRSLRHPDTGL